MARPFAASAAPGVTEPEDPGGWDDEPLPFWSGVKAAFDNTRANYNEGAREARLKDELWRRHRLIEKRLGTRVDTSELMAQPTGAGLEIRPLLHNGAWQDLLSEDAYEQRIEKLRREHPDKLAGVPTYDQVRAGVDQDLRGKAEAAGRAGLPEQILGGVAGSLTDPINAFAAIKTGAVGAGRPLLARMGLQGLVNAGLEGATAPSRMLDAQVAGGPEITLKEEAGNVAVAGLAGVGFEGVFGGVGHAWRAVKGGQAAALRGGLPPGPAGAGPLPPVRGEMAPLERGAMAALEREALADAAIGPLRNGEDHEAALAALDLGAPKPAIEPEKNIGELFTDGPQTALGLPKLADAGGGDLQARAEYRGRAIYAGSFDPRKLEAAPELFQYKSDGDAQGVTARLQGVKSWSPLASGKAIVWEDMAGRRFIADGHQRRGLALRLDAEGFEPRLDGYLLRAADGWSARETRVLAALKNIQEGQGSPLDAAKVFRDDPRAMADDSLPVTGDFIATAKGLARLSPEAFGAVVNKVIPEAQGSLIGRLAGDLPELHAGMVKLLRQAEPGSLEEAGAIIQEARLEDWLKSEGEAGDLFGDLPPETSLIARARLKAAIARTLRGDARVFGTLVKNADAIEAGGNALARNANEAATALAQASLEVISRLALRKGPIGEAMAEAAAKIARGEISPADAAKGLSARIKAELERGVNLEALRGEAIDPAPPTAQAEQLVDGFDEPGGKGQAAQGEPKPEDAAVEDGGLDLFADVQDDSEARGLDLLLERLAPCAPGGS